MISGLGSGQLTVAPEHVHQFQLALGQFLGWRPHHRHASLVKQIWLCKCIDRSKPRQGQFKELRIARVTALMAERWWAGAALVTLRFLVEGGLGGAESLVLLFEAALESDDALAGTEAGVELVTVEGLGDEIVSAGVHP